MMSARLQEIDVRDVDDALARASDFATVEALLATVRRGRGERVFLVDLVFVSDSGG